MGWGNEALKRWYFNFGGLFLSPKKSYVKKLSGIGISYAWGSNFANLKKINLHTRSLGPCDSLPPVWPLAPPIWPNLLSHFFQLISHNFPLYLWIRISTLLHQSFTVKRGSQLVCLTSCLSAVIFLAISCLCAYLSTFLILNRSCISEEMMTMEEGEERGVHAKQILLQRGVFIQKAHFNNSE